MSCMKLACSTSLRAPTPTYMSNSWSVQCSLPPTVQAQKRSWIYSGIAHPPSVVLAQAKKRRRLPAGSRLLLAGDGYAWGLAPFLGLLARDAHVIYSTDLNQGSI